MLFWIASVSNYGAYQKHSPHVVQIWFNFLNICSNTPIWVTFYFIRLIIKKNNNNFLSISIPVEARIILIVTYIPCVVYIHLLSLTGTSACGKYNYVINKNHEYSDPFSKFMQSRICTSFIYFILSTALY